MEQYGITRQIAQEPLRHSAAYRKGALRRRGSPGELRQQRGTLRSLTGTWSATGSLVSVHYTHLAVLLANGKVLIAAGRTTDGAPITATELYDAWPGLLPDLAAAISAAAFDAAGKLTLTGTGFRGVSGASGGNGSQDSPTDFPVVQLRRLDNGQSAFLLSDPATTVSATGFISVPVPTFSGHALVTVFANSIPSAGFIVLFPVPDIGIFRPVATGIGDGGAHHVGSAVSASPSSLTFTIKNPGTANLTGLVVTKDGPNAADFTLTASPASLVVPGGTTTFTIDFVSATSGTKTVALHVASNVPAKHPYDINLTGQAYSFAQDTDGDGLNDASEFQMAPQGFNWQVSQPALVSNLFSSASGAGLFTPSQVQALNVDVPLIQKNAATGQFKLTISLGKSTNLSAPNSFVPFPFTGAATVINGQGKIEFEFTVPDNAAFFRLEAE